MAGGAETPHLVASPAIARRRRVGKTIPTPNSLGKKGHFVLNSAS